MADDDLGDGLDWTGLIEQTRCDAMAYKRYGSTSDKEELDHAHQVIPDSSVLCAVLCCVMLYLILPLT